MDSETTNQTVECLLVLLAETNALMAEGGQELTRLAAAITRQNAEIERLQTLIGRMRSPGPVMQLVGGLNIPGRSFAAVPVQD